MKGKDSSKEVVYNGALRMLNYVEDIFIHAEAEIISDVEIAQQTGSFQDISGTNSVVGAPGQVYLEEGVKMECCILNVENGPIYIAKGAHVMEGSLLRGPLTIGQGSVIKMGAKIYGKTSIGPWCKVGGEVSNSVILGYSNKGHDGYMGNSVIGEWCNWGADTNSSNLKNNYTHVKLWDYSTERFRATDQQFAGLIMGDHSKTGINTMFNTGTVVGVSANIFGSGFPRNFIPSFSWGGANGYKTYQVVKAIETAEAVKKRRKLSLSDIEKTILEHLFKHTMRYRKWEKV